MQNIILLINIVNIIQILTIPHILLCYITRNAQIERHYYVNKVIIENINITNNKISNILHCIIINDRKIILV